MWINKATGAVLRTHSDIRKDAQRISFPAILTDEMIDSHGYATVTKTAPTYNAATQKAVEIAPVEVGGVWVQQWQIVAMTPAEIAAAAAQAKAIADAAAAKADAKLLALADMSPAQARAWVAANVGTLADARELLATLAVAVSVLARKL